MDAETLKKIFISLEDEIYCIVKLEENTLGKVGGDVDIYCENISNVGKKVLKIGNMLIQENLYDSIQLTEDKIFRHVYIDFYKNEKLTFRFDLFGKFPYFNTLEVKPELFKHCLTGRVQRTINLNGNTFSVFVPEENYDLVLRYIEYIEFFPEREDKVKHLSHVAHHLTDEDKRFSFLSAIAFYVLKGKPKKDIRDSNKYKILHFSKRVLRKIKSIILDH